MSRVHPTNWVVLAVSITAALMCAEFFVRALYPQKLSLNVTQWDRYVGFVNAPGTEGASETSEFKMDVRINSRGLRDKEFSFRKAPDTYRIGVLGDSFTFGEGVQAEETYPKVLERLLKNTEALRHAKLDVEVLNFGIGKTGTSHQLAFYQKEARRYGLDLLILGFLSGNDFDDNWGGVFFMRDGELVHNPASYSSVRMIQKLVQRIPFYEWGARHSHLVNLARTAATVYDDQNRTRNASVGNGSNEETATGFGAAQLRLTLRLLEELRRGVEEDQGRFLLLNLPARDQRPSFDYARSGEEPPIFVDQCDALMRQLATDKFKILDLTSVFRNLPSDRYYFRNDGHMNVHGHEEVASQLYPIVIGEALAQRSRNAN